MTVADPKTRMCGCRKRGKKGVFVDADPNCKICNGTGKVAK